MKITASLLAFPLLLLPVACSSEDVANAADSAMGSAKNAAGSIGEMAGNLSESLGDVASLGKDGLVEKLSEVQPMIASAIEAIKEKTPDMGDAMKDKLSTLMEYKDEIPALLTKLKDGGMDGMGDLLTRAKDILTSLPELMKGLGN